MDKFEQWFKTYRPSLDTSAIEAEFIFEAGQQSRQAEVEEKDKRIESALYVLKGLKAENDLWGCDQVEVQIEILEKALRGEQ